MTKPIEGWVFCDEHDEPLAMKTMVGGNIRERFSVAKELLEGDTKERYRPVQITFTDEPSDEIAEAVRKERERIARELQSVDEDNSPFFMCMQKVNVKKAIFGEEK